jgi:hypothetical protein
LSRNVGLVFAVAASTLCPLLVLGIWWRGLTSTGAISGLGPRSPNRRGTGGHRCDRRRRLRWLARQPGRLPRGHQRSGDLSGDGVGQPIHPGSSVADILRVFARMHVPERLGMGVERVPTET